MIGIDFTGRLGNQLFTYAFARHVWERRGGTDALVANFKRSQVGAADEGYDDGLRHFCTLPYRTTTADLTLRHGSLTQRAAYLLYALLGKWSLTRRNDRLMTLVERRLERSGIYFTGVADRARVPQSPNQRALFVRGYFQDRANFDAIRPILLREFTPKQPPLAHNSHLYAAAARPNSVCVSVRRGDYLSEQHRRDFYVCTPDYFRQAIALLAGRLDNPTFLFFSNDIEWVRRHISVPAGVECYYESGTDPAWETLRLMSCCHHFVISNSTFAWWAQYLGRRPGKLVVSPSRWFANPAWTSNLIDDSFLQIPVAPR